MKDTTSVSSQTVLVVRFLLQQNLPLVRIQTTTASVKYAAYAFYFIFLHTAVPTSIHSHPSELKVTPGQPATFTVEATGTEPLSYQWQWKPAGEEKRGSEEWQQCKMEWSDDNTLKIPSVQKCNEGSYQCVVSNCAGIQISTSAQLSISKF